MGGINVLVLSLPVLCEPSHIYITEPALFLGVEEFFILLLEPSSPKQRETTEGRPCKEDQEKTAKNIPRL